MSSPEVQNAVKEWQAASAMLHDGDWNIAKRWEYPNTTYDISVSVDEIFMFFIIFLLVLPLVGLFQWRRENR